jgi:phenylpropionate dioxygenase-like ring-hydroxylating dioxygenase large terminal subunit
MFIRNSWYVAAWSNEVGTDVPLGRTLLDEPVVLFRNADQGIVALAGRCAHRGMPLAHAKIEGNTIVCCYHGLTYDSTGACVRVPGQAQPPKNIRVRSYPVVERYGAVWIWMGDPALADESKVFACTITDRQGATGEKFYFHVKSNYLYLNDNLSDLLHQAYLHEPSFGGNTQSLGETIPTITQQGEQTLVHWDWVDVGAPGFFADVGGIAGKADGWNHSTYQPPSFYINETGFADAATGGKASARSPGNGKLCFTIYQLITPETARSTHFFKIVHCDWPAKSLPKLRPYFEAVNLEDIWACEEQQKMQDIHPAPMSMIPTDKAVAAMRRSLQRLQQEELQRSQSSETDRATPSTIIDITCDVATIAPGALQLE